MNGAAKGASPQAGTKPAADRVYVGRPSKWGNPFVIGRDGTRDEVVAKYRASDPPAASAHGGVAETARQTSRLLVGARALSRIGADRTREPVSPGIAATCTGWTAAAAFPPLRPAFHSASGSLMAPTCRLLLRLQVFRCVEGSKAKGPSPDQACSKEVVVVHSLHTETPPMWGAREIRRFAQRGNVRFRRGS